MNLIDRVLLEWSYKTKKGYPDINSQEDVALFESMFGFNITEEITKGNNINPNRYIRLNIFFDKSIINKSLYISK